MRDSLTDKNSIYPVKYAHYYPTEIEAIDGLLNGGGVWPDEFTFLCGRPGIGKTAVATAIASNMAFCGSRVMYIDLEHNPATLAFLGGEAEADEYIDDNLEIHYTFPATLPSIANAIKESDAEVVIVDYIQLLDLNPAKDWQDIRRSLPSGRAYIIVSQISRDADSRECHCPNLSDLKGALRFDGIPNATIMLYRDSYYEGAAPSEMEAFVYRGEDIRGHGHWKWTPKQFIDPYLKVAPKIKEIEEDN